MRTHDLASTSRAKTTGFTVLAPRGWSEAGAEGRSSLAADLIVEHEPDTAIVRIDGWIRFLHIVRRWRERPGDPGDPWHEVLEHSLELTALVPGASSRREIAVGGERSLTKSDDGAFVVSERTPLRVAIATAAAAIAPCRSRLRVVVDNVTPLDTSASRETVLRSSLVGAHLILSASGGRFALRQPRPPEIVLA